MKNTEQKFALAMISTGGCRPFAAMVIGEQVIAVNAFLEIPDIGLDPLRADSIRALLDDWENSLDSLKRARAYYQNHEQNQFLRRKSLAIEQVQFHPPVDAPRQVFCTGANYRQHVIGLMLGDPDMRGVGREAVNDPAELRKLAEATMDERAAGGTPYVFLRLPNTLIGAHENVHIPKHFTKPDWELELAVVIGRSAKNVAAADAPSYIAGYAIINDLTARELIFRKDMPAMGADWLQGKNWRDSGPFGPFLVPSCFVTDPYDLKIQLWLNDRLMQDESTSDMVISIERQIEYLSSIATLNPGDVIATGSPAGNGSHYGVFIQPGDEITGEITGLGRQHLKFS